MLVLRLQRTGRRNVPTYRLVVTEKSAPVKGRVKEYLGHYLPMRNPHVLEFKSDRVTHWVSQGAQPSDTVARILTQAGMKGLEKFIKPYTKKRKKEKKEQAAKGAAPPAVAVGAEKEEKGKVTKEAEEKSEKKTTEKVAAEQEEKKPTERVEKKDEEKVEKKEEKEAGDEPKKEVVAERKKE